MKKTHSDLVHTIEMDMIMEGFSPAALQPLTDHRAAFGGKDGPWFNNSDNYKTATNAVIDAKLECCCAVLKADAATVKERELAAGNHGVFVF